MYSNEPAWKWLIDNSHSIHERIPMIAAIFSGHDQVETIGQLSGGDAQIFVDIIDGVSPHTT